MTAYEFARESRPQNAYQFLVSHQTLDVRHLELRESNTSQTTSAMPAPS